MHKLPNRDIGAHNVRRIEVRLEGWRNPGGGVPPIHEVSEDKESFMYGDKGHYAQGIQRGKPV